MNQSVFDKLMQKPESYRKRIAFLATFVIGTIIIFAWLLIAGRDIEQAVRPKVDNQQAADRAKRSLPSLKEETLKTQLNQEQKNNDSFDTLLEKEKAQPKEFKIIER